jgi:uncharacterized protein (TIGR03435 family)
MKKLVLLLIAFMAGSGGALYAQSIAGSWQGTLPGQRGGPALRLVFQISNNPDQTLKAVAFSIDQGGQPITASAVTFQSSNLKITLSAIGGVYEGRLGADGNTITGTWTQGAPTPMNLARATPTTAWAIPEPPPPPKPMAADASLAFEVATIKPSDPAVPGQSILVGRGGANMFTTTNTTLNDLLVFAYGIHPQQLSGGPSWLGTERFDITAKPEALGVPDATQLRTMVQKLLTERFNLAFRREKKELSAYTLTVGRNGPKLSKNESGGTLPGFGGRGPGAIGVRNSTMTEFASFLQARILDRPVVDQTSLSGKWDFTLEWRPDPTQAGPNAPQLPPEVASRPDIFTAFQEQIGLKLEATKTPVEVFVIDRVEKPSEN